MRFETDHKTYKIGKLFYLLTQDGLWWFRIFNGYGLHGKNWRKNGLSFSDRYAPKHTRLKIGNWIFKILKP